MSERPMKDWRWYMPEEGESHKYDFNPAILSVLMDLRDELKLIRAILKLQRGILNVSNTNHHTAHDQAG